MILKIASYMQVYILTSKHNFQSVAVSLYSRYNEYAIIEALYEMHQCTFLNEKYPIIKYGLTCTYIQTYDGSETEPEQTAR